MSADLDISMRKLKIRHAHGAVTVIQDGAAADLDATVKYDDGFSNGINVGGAIAHESDEIRVELVQIEASYTGTRFSFRVRDRIYRNWLNIQVYDRIEFSCRRGDAIATSGPALPAWHHLSQADATQIRIFTGRVISSSPRRSGGEHIWEFECEDARATANKMKVVRDFGNGNVLPHLVMNVDDPRDQDWIVSVKKTAPGVFATGHVATHAGRMTVYDGLKYLATTYASELTARGIKDSGVDLFEESEISALTTEMPRIDFVQSGFAQAVERVLQVVPDYGLVIDPRTKKWHVVKVRFDVVAGQVATTTGAGTDNGNGTWTFPVSDTAIFSTSSAATGKNVLFTDVDNPQWANRLVVSAINPGVSITVNTPNWPFTTGSTVVPLYPDSQRLPTMTIDLGTHADQITLRADLTRSFSAVRITAATNTVTEGTSSQFADFPSASKILKAWDTDYEADWETRHGDREADWGADGQGIELYRHEVSNGKSVLYFRAAKSQYGKDHKIINQKSEWTGCAVKWLLNLGDDQGAKNPPIASRIVAFQRNDLDGSGTDGFVLRLSHDLLSHPDGLTTIVSETQPVPGEVPDRFILTHDPDLLDLDGAAATSSFNQRFMVYRAFAAVETEVTVQRDSQNQCPPTVSGFVGPGFGIRAESAFNPLQQSGAPRSFQEQEQFWQPILGTPVGVGWAPRIWFLKKPQPNHFDAVAACQQAAAARPEPKRLEVKFRRTSNEVKNVRVPANGFSGLSYLWHRLSEELVLSTDQLKSEADKVRWQAIAEAIWREVSPPTYRGDLNLPGAAPWLGLLDLGIFVALSSSMVPAGSVQEFARFGAPLASVLVDFENVATTISFQNRGILAEIEGDLLDSLFIDAKARQKALEDKANSTEHAVGCLNRPINHAPQLTNDCETAASVQPGPPTNGRRIPAPFPVKEEAEDLAESSGEFLNAAGQSAVRGMSASGVLEEDAAGRVFFSDGAGIRPGKMNGKTWVPDDASPHRLRSKAAIVAEDLANVLKSLVGVDLAYGFGLTHGQVGPGATDTVIPLKFPRLRPGEASGGTLTILDGIARPTYAIGSHTDDRITLAGVMIEPPPAAGSVAIVRPPRKPLLSSTDFPDGGTAWKDALGRWFVSTPTGQVVSAGLSGGVIVATGANAPQLAVVTRRSLDDQKIDWEHVVEFAANQSFDAGGGLGIGVTDPKTTDDEEVYASVLMVVEWADGVKAGCAFSFVVPRDFDPTQAITAEFRGILFSAPRSTDAIEIQIDARATADNEARNSGGALGSTSAVIVVGSSGRNYGADDEVVIDLGTIFAAGTVEPGDLVHGVIYRDATGGNGDDDYGDVQAVNVVFRGKRRLTGADNDGAQIGGADAEDTARYFFMG